jgi:hypothetical protein
MAVELLTPFTAVNRRSAPKASSNPIILTGRFYAIDSTGSVALPALAAVGVYLAVEGDRLHIGSPSDFSAGASTNYVLHNAVTATGHIALAYGVYRVKIGPEAVDQAITLALNDKLKVDTLGRLTNATVVDDNCIAYVEAFTGTTGAYTDVTIRTTGR